METLNLNEDIYKRLEAQAQADNCTVEQLIENLLTYRQETATELQQVKFSLDEAMQAGRVGLWNWDLTRDESVYSVEWKRLLGYDATEEVNRHDHFIGKVHPQDLPHLQSVIQKTISEIRQKQTVEFRLQGKDGIYRWIMATGSIMTNEAGQPERLIGSIIDITQQKETEEALRQSEQRYRKVIENLNDMCVLYSSDLKIVMVNEMAIVYTGIPKADLVDNNSEIIFVNQAMYARQLQKTAETKTMHTGEITIMTPHGERSLIFKHIPILDERKNLENIVSITHDITEHKQIQASEFELMLERERMQLLGEFVQDTAHEFRTPLSTIKSNTYLMKMTGLSNELHPKTDQINIQVARLQRLVDTLLMMTKLERSEELSFASIDLHMLLQRICDDIRSEYKDNTPQLICNIPPNLPSILGDVTYLAEAVKQVVDNAVRFTPSDGQITVSASINSDWHRLSIVDTGIGISKEAMPNIFKTFWRQDEAHTTPGFGLGLPIAKKIIDLHHGGINVTSHADAGTTVQILLPPSRQA